MNDHKHLIVDADLEIVHDSGPRISLQFISGQGVIELSDVALLRSFIKSTILNRQRRYKLQQLLQPVSYLKARIDIAVVGRRIARLDTEQKGGFICRSLGLPYFRVWPVAFFVALLSPGPKPQ